MSRLVSGIQFTGPDEVLITYLDLAADVRRNGESVLTHQLAIRSPARVAVLRTLVGSGLDQLIAEHEQSEPDKPDEADLALAPDDDLCPECGDYVGVCSHG